MCYDMHEPGGHHAELSRTRWEPESCGTAFRVSAANVGDREERDGRLRWPTRQDGARVGTGPGSPGAGAVQG